MGHSVALQEGELQLLPRIQPQTDLLTLLQAVLVCNLLCIAAAADGYQININGMCITVVCSAIGSDVGLREHYSEFGIHPPHRVPRREGRLLSQGRVHITVGCSAILRAARRNDSAEPDQRCDRTEDDPVPSLGHLGRRKSSVLGNYAYVD